MTPNYYSRIALIAALLAWIVIMLGAYTRLSDAGLGCPDWPGCYGHLTVPKTTTEIEIAQNKFPGLVVEAHKAWKEMVHRYFAGTLGLLIAFLAVWGIIRRRHHPLQPVVLPILLVLLVVFQAALGMWTVTWKVLPMVVSAHLLGGMALVVLLWYLYLATKPPATTPPLPQKIKSKKNWVVLGLCIVVAQIFLGAWTSTTYSALACHDFPFCNGTLFPNLTLSQAFQIFQPIGVNYEGGVLETPVRITIQMVHRYGALITALYVGALSCWLIFSNHTKGLRGIGGILIGVLILQILLGIGNVMLGLPLWTAVAHNGVAALLLISLVTLLRKFR